MVRSKGFTIMELIVVISIIAVLATIVLVNVTQYINKGKNAAIQANLSSALTNAAVYFSSNGTYVNYCIDHLYTGAGEQVHSITGINPTCVATATAWCACSDMKVTSAEPAGSTFCVDSTGYKKVTQNANGCAARCPAAGGCID